MLRTSLSVRLDAEAQSVSIARTTCRAALARLGVTDACADDLALAVAEACTNAVEHSPPTAGSPETFEVRVDVVGSWCHIEVLDHGSGFDIAAAGQTLPRPDQVRGRGIAIMRKVTDDVTVQSTIGAGTRVLLAKRLALQEWSPLREVSPSS